MFSANVPLTRKGGVPCTVGWLVAAGAYQQLAPGVLVVSPLDIYGTAEAMHQALTMPAEERRERAERLRSLVEGHDIVDWLNQQLSTIIKLKL